MTAGAYLLLRRWRILKNLSGVITTLAAAELVIIIAHRETPRSCCCCFPDRNDDDDDCILKKSLAQIFADYYKSIYKAESVLALLFHGSVLSIDENNNSLPRTIVPLFEIEPDKLSPLRRLSSYCYAEKSAKETAVLFNLVP